ncbi:hypothetical protein ColLi_13249 [Colletotrichum liriopes]|uniref:Uncharacterized protein n=1 Tax=Colletotrichum liriopes TaxID=708192 RepID=A0AA37H1U6_9PEZI|nr:hypothetical protein ColLi_13249 [Colletotrichum liriopes]
MGSASRSRSRGRVDRAQRCHMLRRFHKALIGRGPEGKSFLVHFTAEALEQINRLIGDEDWKLVAAGEDAFSTK